jgi:hypothetical protein
MTECPKPPTSVSNLYDRIRARFAPLGGADDLEIPPREPCRELPCFNDVPEPPSPDEPRPASAARRQAP